MPPEPKATRMHPLSGSDPTTFARVLWRNGLPRSGRNWATALLAAGAVLGRSPFTLAEKVWARRRLARDAAPEAPVFILGHWRSGTTHLYNVMARRGFAYVPPIATGMPWDLFGLARWLRPLLERALPEHRYIDSVPVHPDSPQEDEIAIANMCDLSFYHGLYFPRHFQENFDRGVFFDDCSEADIAMWRDRLQHLLGKLSLQFGGQRLLLKNPVHTGRVALLREIWPDAAFIHIHRNPYAVFQSMRNFYRKLLAELALQPFTHIDFDTHILASYARLMRRFDADRPGIPDGHFVEIDYQELMERPMEALATIYDRLGLPGFAEAAPDFAAYLSTVASYQKNSYAYSAADAELVEAHWQPWIDRWGYRRPDGAAV